MWSWTQSGRILPDGGALIGEFSQGSVYRLGPDGGVVESWGRKGQGPDEYQGFDSIILHGDSVVVSDGRLGRVTIRGPDGGIRTIQRTDGLSLHRVSTVLPDGRLILEPSDGYGGAPLELRPEWVFETEPVVALTPDGADPQVLAELPHLRRWYGTRGAPPGIIRIQGRVGGFDEGFAWARSDRPEVHWYDGSGTLLQVARWDDDPAPLDAAWRDEFLQEMGERMGLGAGGGPAAAARRTEMEERLDLHDGPLPWWGEFRVDGSGAVWMGRYAMPLAPPEQWRVVTREGVVAGWVELPGALVILDATEDRVLAVRLNELEVPAVTMFGLRRR